jgi:hypothetical protein
MKTILYNPIFINP